MSNKILVTGAGGQLGQEIKDASATVTGFEFIFVTREELSINNEEQVNFFFEKHRPLFCINCAAYTGVDKAETETDQAFLINGSAVGILAAACKKYRAKFIHISTDYVFNGTSKVPYSEDDKVDPVNLYGASKLKGEKLALEQSDHSLIIRTSWVYSVHGNNFVKTMIRLMKERESISVVEDQVGSPTYAADLAQAILDIIQSSAWKPGVYHYSNGGIISWYQFALAIKEFTNSPCLVKPIPTSAYPTPAKRPQFSAFNKDKIQANYSLPIKDWKQSLWECIGKMH